MLKKALAILLVSINWVPLHAEGFRGDTLVYTPSGFQPISIIGKGSQVYCYSSEGKLVVGDVIGSEKTNTYRYDSLNVNNQEIAADPEQYFFCPKRNTWTKLIELDIEKDSVLSHLQGPLSLTKRHRVATMIRNINVPMYKISVKDHQNFFVTKQCFLVHNYTPPTIPLSSILINTVIDLGVTIAISCVSELVTKDLAPRLKNACARLLPSDGSTNISSNNNYNQIFSSNTAQQGELPNPNKNANNSLLLYAREKLINKFNAQQDQQNNCMLVAKKALPRAEVHKLVTELVGPNAEKSADGSYWFSIEKLANGGTLTRRNHFPAKTGNTFTGEEAAHFEIHYSHGVMPEKTKTIVAIHVPIKD